MGNPLSAYAFFFKETQNSIKSQQPNATFESVSKIVETMWQALEESQKEKYRKMNEADKERFKREKEAFDRGVPSGSVVTTVRVAQAPAEPGTVQCIRVGCTNPSVRNVEWEDEIAAINAWPCIVTKCSRIGLANSKG